MCDVGNCFSGLGRPNEPVGLVGTVSGGGTAYYEKFRGDGGCFLSGGPDAEMVLCWFSVKALLRGKWALIVCHLV